MSFFKSQITKHEKKSQLKRYRVRLDPSDQPTRSGKLRVRFSAVERKAKPRRWRHIGQRMIRPSNMAEVDLDNTYLTTAQAAEALGLSSKTLQNWRVYGDGPAFTKFGSAVRYLYAELRQWAAERSRTSTSNAGGIGQ